MTTIRIVKTLVVVRHGKSDWTTGVPDRERPLNARGQRQAMESGIWLAEHVPHVDQVIVSPAERTRSTWSHIGVQYDRPPHASFDERLYGGRVRHVIDELPETASTAVIVGHNPDVEILVQQLSGKPLDMPTSCIAVLEWEGSWVEGAGRATVRAHGRPPG